MLARRKTRPTFTSQTGVSVLKSRRVSVINCSWYPWQHIRCDDLSTRKHRKFARGDNLYQHHGECYQIYSDLMFCLCSQVLSVQHGQISMWSYLCGSLSNPGVERYCDWIYSRYMPIFSEGIQQCEALLHRNVPVSQPVLPIENANPVTSGVRLEWCKCSLSL